MLSDDEVGGFIRDGYVVVRTAFDAATAADCRTAIWAVLAAHGITADDPATWTQPAVRVPWPEGSAFDAIADAPELVDACDRLIGAGR